MNIKCGKISGAAPQQLARQALFNMDLQAIDSFPYETEALRTALSIMKSRTIKRYADELSDDVLRFKKQTKTDEIVFNSEKIVDCKTGNTLTYWENPTYCVEVAEYGEAFMSKETPMLSIYVKVPNAEINNEGYIYNFYNRRGNLELDWSIEYTNPENE